MADMRLGICKFCGSVSTIKEPIRGLEDADKKADELYRKGLLRAAEITKEVKKKALTYGTLRCDEIIDAIKKEANANP